MGVLAVLNRRREPAVDVFSAAGEFLRAHRLTPEPENYALAYATVAEPDGAIALEVARLTEGGLRLGSADLVRLGGVPNADMAVVPAAARPVEDAADALVARTQAQVAGFRDTVHAMSVEAQGFGRDLAAAVKSADVLHLASSMIDRARLAETRLALATREADELRAALDEARGSARRDPLTDLPNRRAFDEAYAERDPASGQTALAIIDIDRFKQVNDRFGHTVGDRVLKLVGTALAESCPDCLVARYGGEEFVMLFDSLEAARSIVEETRLRIAARRLRVRETEEPIGAITFSAGITAAMPGEALEVAMARADGALYAAKQSGRNCVREAPKVGA